MVKFSVQPDGRVHAAHVTTGKFKGTPTATCVEQQVGALRFPAFGGQAMDLTTPFAL